MRVSRAGPGGGPMKSWSRMGCAVIVDCPRLSPLRSAGITRCRRASFPRCERDRGSERGGGPGAISYKVFSSSLVQAVVLLDRGVQLEEALLKLGIDRIARERQAIPGPRLVQAREGPAGIAEGDEYLGIVALRGGTGVLDEPLEVVAFLGGTKVGLCGLGRAGEAEGLAQPEQSVAVVGIGRQRGPVMAHGGAIAPGQRQAAAEPGQRGVIGRASGQ